MAMRSWKRQIARLERAGNDDFLLILTGGAAAYETYELHHLLRRLRLRAQRLRRLRLLMFRTALAVPLLLFLACGFGLAGLHAAVYGCLFTLPVCLLLLGAGARYTGGGRFACHGRATRLRCIIQQELERRRKDVTC